MRNATQVCASVRKKDTQRSATLRNHAQLKRASIVCVFKSTQEISAHSLRNCNKLYANVRVRAVWKQLNSVNAKNGNLLFLCTKGEQ